MQDSFDVGGNNLSVTGGFWKENREEMEEDDVHQMPEDAAKTLR